MMASIKNYLGVDYGQVRLGLALASSDARLAAPFKTLQKVADPLPALKQIIAEHNIGTIVVGLPRNLEGDDTNQTASVRRFIDTLSSLHLPVVCQDEAGTSSVAKERMGRKTFRLGEIDSEAAAIILQDYLNGLPRND